MRHVEAVIKMLDPAYNLARITVKRRQPNKWFKRGTTYRRAVDVLRTATRPMTTPEIGAVIKKDPRTGLPYIECPPNAPISRMSADEIYAIIHKSQEEEDLERLGASLRR